MSYRSPLGSASVGSGSEASESIVSREGQSFVGVLGFALTRLQNLTSGVWLKMPALVAAKAADGAQRLVAKTTQVRNDAERWTRSGRLRSWDQQRAREEPPVRGRRFGPSQPPNSRNTVARRPRSSGSSRPSASRYLDGDGNVRGLALQAPHWEKERLVRRSSCRPKRTARREP